LKKNKTIETLNDNNSHLLRQVEELNDKLQLLSIDKESTIIQYNEIILNKDNKMKQLNEQIDLLN